jgi:hypothetical protein
MLLNCKSTFSVDLSENVTRINDGAFAYCNCLRNVAFPQNAVFGDNVIILGSNGGMTDFQLLFGNSNGRIISALMHRFDGLPIHRIVYYQSYNQGVLQILIAVINMKSDQCRTLRSELDTKGNQQDCLGMTPLHILTCSSVHDIEVYRVIVENYPSNLITEDKWGATPLLYAFWGAAPTEIIQFLLESYQSLYPDYLFNWTNMVWTIGRTNAPKEHIQNLLGVKQMHFLEQSIDWGYLLDKFAEPSPVSFDGAPFQERMQFLFMCGMSMRVEALAFKVWRDCITNMIQTAAYKHDKDNATILHEIQERLAYFEDEYPRLKEATSMLELALWKITLDVNSHKMETNRCQKKMRSDESVVRRQCRVTCGADIVITHVLPYLITVSEDEESDSDSDDESNNSMSS